MPSVVAAAGLALLAPTPVELTNIARWLADDPGAAAMQTKAALARAALARAAERGLDDDLAVLTAIPVYRPPRAR